MQGNDNYYTNGKYKCLFLFVGKENFLTNLKLWVAVSSRGLSKTGFHALFSVDVDSDN